ncbi:MAG TPA: DUF4350 domain-containing protein, partial [Micromonosporaceae bacterium]|nr:DUF4350 domain-containing protein [Micromonosporaceae bacterium]
DRGTLSPTGAGPDGSSRLAALLAARGVTIERYGNSEDAMRAAARGGVTVFVPAPRYPLANVVARLAQFSPDSRLVVVEPAPGDQFDLPIRYGPRRWAPRTPRPGCANSLAAGAGRATVVRTRYGIDDFAVTTERRSCYAGGLLQMRWLAVEFVVVGATDPFRNSRLDEYGNAALATGLLAGRPRLVWLDLHEYETLPVSTGGGGVPPSPRPSPPPEATRVNPLWTAVPPTFWPVLVQLALVALLLAFWRARRLGPPVPEPLPIAVPAAETVTGRGRLYDRADARGPALDALRAAARHRLLRLLDLPPDAAEPEVVGAVAARTGVPQERVRAILYDGEPAGDDQLVAAATALDALVYAASTEPRTGNNVQGGQLW